MDGQSEEALLAELVAIFHVESEAATWATPWLRSAWRTNAEIPEIQWDGKEFIAAAAVPPGKQSWSMTARGFVAELRQARRERKFWMMDLLARVARKS